MTLRNVDMGLSLTRGAANDLRRSPDVVACIMVGLAVARVGAVAAGASTSERGEGVCWSMLERLLD